MYKVLTVIIFLIFAPILSFGQLNPTEKEALITFRLFHPENEKAWPTKIITITNSENQKSYNIRTDLNGEAKILLPNNTVYKLHLENLPNFGKVEIGSSPFQRHYIPIPYDGSSIKNSVKKALSLQIQITDKAGNILQKKEAVELKDGEGKIFRINTDNRGRAIINLETKNPYSISFNGAPDYHQFSVPEQNNSWEERVIFERKTGYSLFPNTKEGLINFIYTDLENNALADEKFNIINIDNGKSYSCSTNKYGIAQILVPLNSTYSISTEFNHNFDNIEVKLREGFHVFEFEVLYQSPSSADWRKRIKILDAASAFKDSILALNLNSGEDQVNLEHHIPLKNRKTFFIRKDIEKKAAVYKDSLVNNPKIFEKHKDPVLSTLKRMNRDLSTAVIVTDVTHSMEPYMEEVLMWHALNLGKGNHMRFVFFNDGDDKLSREKTIGNTGGIYLTEGSLENLDSIILKMQEATKARMGGGEAPENDLEAVKSAIKNFNNVDEVILIADAHSPVRDMVLLKEISVPIRIILCGAEELNSFYFNKTDINEQYLTIAHRTGGSVHTLSADILDLSKRKEGDVVELQGIRYLLRNRQFVKLN
jgi:hypothetical protein